MIVDPQVVVDREFITGVKPENIQPNSIDLSINEIFTIHGALTLYADKERELPYYKPIEPFINFRNKKMYKLEPGKRYQVEFNEKLNLPGNLCGLTLVRSSMAKSGCTGENGLFDSGYKGSCGMMVSVQEESFVEVGACIAQMLFFEADSSKLYEGFYQNMDSPFDWATEKKIQHYTTTPYIQTTSSAQNSTLQYIYIAELER